TVSAATGTAASGRGTEAPAATPAPTKEANASTTTTTTPTGKATSSSQSTGEATTNASTRQQQAKAKGRRFADGLLCGSWRQRRSRRQLLCVARRGLGDLAASLVSRHVDQGDRIALLVVSAARIVGHLFPIRARCVALGLLQLGQSARR